MTGPIFVTNNEGKHQEVERWLAGLGIRFRRLDLSAPQGSDVESIARARVTEAYARLQEPCFCERSGLFLWDHPNALGIDFKNTLRAIGEEEIGKRFGGSRGVARVAVAFEDGKGARVFSGSISGTLLREPRGEGGFGWDRLWVPDGYDRTLAEMKSSKLVVNMRAAPYLELGDHLRGETRAGTFEAHVTVAACDLDAFRAACSELSIKCITIELARGETRHQPMTGSFHRGELPEVEREVVAIAQELAKRGFEVTRTKVERHGHLEETTPATDDEARRAPRTCYFEYHIKLVVSPDADLAALGARFASLGAHMSRNARNENNERFVTLRVRDAGRRAAEARFAEVLALCESEKLEVRSRIREYTVLDTNLDLDRGWLS